MFATKSMVHWNQCFLQLTSLSKMSASYNIWNFIICLCICSDHPSKNASASQWILVPLAHAFSSSEGYLRLTYSNDGSTSNQSMAVTLGHQSLYLSQSQSILSFRIYQFCLAQCFRFSYINIKAQYYLGILF